MERRFLNHGEKSPGRQKSVAYTPWRRRSGYPRNLTSDCAERAGYDRRHGMFWLRQRPTFVDKIYEFDPRLPSPRIIGRRDDDHSVFVQHFRDHIVARNRIEPQQDDQIEAALPKFMEKPLGRSLHDMKIDARIFQGHLADNGSNDPNLGDGRSRTNVYFSCCRVLDGLDFPEEAAASFEKYAPIRRRFDTFGAGMKEKHAKGVLNVGDGPRDGRFGHR